MSRFQHGSKLEWQEEAREILHGKISVSADDIPELMEWVQDWNWPAASEVGEFLRLWRGDLTEQFLRVLLSDDPMWKYWVLINFNDSRHAGCWAQLLSELKAIAMTCDPDDVYLEAFRVLATHKLLPPHELKASLDALRVAHPREDSGYDELVNLVS